MGEAFARAKEVDGADLGDSCRIWPWEYTRSLFEGINWLKISTELCLDQRVQIVIAISASLVPGVHRTAPRTHLQNKVPSTFMQVRALIQMGPWHFISAITVIATRHATFTPSYSTTIVIHKRLHTLLIHLPSIQTLCDIPNYYRWVIFNEPQPWGPPCPPSST